MYGRNLDLCLSVRPSVKKDVVIPGEFRNLQVNLENEGCVRKIFRAARACSCSIKGFCKPQPVFLDANDYRHEYYLTYTGKCGYNISFCLVFGTIYGRNLDLCLSVRPSVKKDVVVPGEFRNLQVNLEDEGRVRKIFRAARACSCSIKGFCKPQPVFLDAND